MIFKKKNIISVLLLGCICFIVLSCHQRKKSYFGYYNIDSLIESQIHYLPSRIILLDKKTGLNGKFDSVQIAVTDTILWSKELEVFRQLNIINKPIYAHSYHTENLPDVKSNLMVRSLISNEKIPIKYLKIYYQGSTTNLRMIEAFYHEENLLYGSSRKLLMEFENIYNKITLVSYSIDGRQKMFLGDSVKFFLSGTVIIN